jgi:glycosyltransferase involved in cell wall biosynthesis
MAVSETSMKTSGLPEFQPDVPTLSIVIPAFNESARIGDSIAKVKAFVEKFPMTSEVIVVDDGSSDATADIVRKCELPSLRLLRNERNHGKGYSVRQGVLNARGQYVLFTDADLSAPIEELTRLLDIAMNEHVDVVIGSRAVDRGTIEKHQTRFRELGGIGFNKAVRLMLGLDIQDTQCGFKLFERERTRRIFEKQTTLGFGFDPEILFLAARYGLKIREVPVRWSHAEGSKLNPIRDGLRMFSDLARVRLNYILGKYS